MPHRGQTGEDSHPQTKRGAWSGPSPDLGSGLQNRAAVSAT